MSQVRRIAPQGTRPMGRGRYVPPAPPVAPTPAARKRRPAIVRAIEGLLWVAGLTIIATVIVMAYLAAVGQADNAFAVARYIGDKMTGGQRLHEKAFRDTAGKATVLLLGTDETNNLCDTILLAFINENTKRVGLMSLPRDTRVHFPDNGWDKLAHTVPYGMDKLRSMDKAILLVKQTVEENFHIPVDHFVRVDVKGFEELVDYIGGVEIDVEKDMKYTDRSQKLYINLRKGRQLLKGYDAMCYVRFRHDKDGDWGRMHRQQQFLAALADQLGARVEGESGLSPGNLLDLRKLASIAMKYCDTDLTTDQLLGLGNTARGVDIAGVQTKKVPGKDVMYGGLYFFEVDLPGLLAEVVDLKAALGSENAPPLFAKIAVLNGCGVSGIAGDVGRILEEQGLQVTKVGNYSQQSLIDTLIRYEPGYEETASLIKATLGPSPLKTTEDPSLKGSEHNVEVILGRSYSTHHLP